MFGKNSYIEHLKSVPLFSTLSNKELSAVAKAADEIDLPAGHDLCVEGDQGHEAYVLLAGQATVKRNNRKVADLGPGDIIGELALLENAPRGATVTCSTDCTVLVLDRRHFSGLVQGAPGLAFKFLQTLAGRLRELDRTAFG
jgi:CRP/FNR family transcriptional regulator, cyclic AMP receptor protein